MGRHQKYLRIFLSFVLAISPIIFINQANAETVGGWTMSNPIAQGASAIYTGTKKVLLNGVEAVKTGKAKITPVATDVAKVLARGGATLALTVAVEQLLGAVDWVLDPENNRIIYYESDFTFNCTTGSTRSTGPSLIIAAENTCKAFSSTSSSVSYLSVEITGDTTFNCRYKNAGGNNSYASSCTKTAVVDKDKPQYLPLPTVGQKVISNAESGDTNAQAATMAAAANIVKDASTDPAKAPPIVQQLENSAATSTDETATGESTTKTDPETGNQTTDLSIEFPAFCGWAPTVCEAAQTVISFPTTLTNWWDTATSSISEAWTFAKDWATSQPETDTNLDIDTSQESEPNTDISFSTSCPAKIPLQFNWNGQSLDFSFDFTIWCQAISTYVYPIVVTLGSLHALYIVTGVRQDG